MKILKKKTNLLLYLVIGIVSVSCMAFSIFFIIFSISEYLSNEIEFEQMASIVLSSFSAFGLVFAAAGFVISIKTKADAHDEALRMKTFDIIVNWSNGNQENQLKAIKIAESLDPKDEYENMQKLFLRQAFYVNGQKFKLIIKDFCKSTIISEIDENGTYCIDDEPLYALRASVINFLNDFEAILVGRRLSIVNEEVITEEFGPLLRDEEISDFINKLKKFEPTTYPSLYSFLETIENKFVVRKPIPDKVPVLID
ncbi:MAG: hypothetical protein LBM93_05910 [Oscillospiraceae bacterium]|nr:hypothetical protein [Oscillospiraceae bacterium]